MKIFVDLDEVLVDYRRAMNHLGFNLDEINADDNLTKMFWKYIDARAQKGKTFWGGMDPLPDAFVLWSYVKKYDCEILTAARPHGRPQREKIDWVKRHLGDVKVNFVERSFEKSKYANPNHILIDDKQRSIEPWIKQGGIGILHQNAQDTIQQLKILGL